MLGQLIMRSAAVTYKKDSGSPLLDAAVWDTLVSRKDFRSKSYAQTLTLILAIQYAKAMGFKVVGVDVSNSQLDAAKSLGAELTLNTLDDPDWEGKIKKISNGGCHAVAVFSSANAAYESAPKMLR